jgi:hypothetical protein
MASAWLKQPLWMLLLVPWRQQQGRPLVQLMLFMSQLLPGPVPIMRWEMQQPIMDRQLPRSRHGQRPLGNLRQLVLRGVKVAQLTA